MIFKRDISTRENSVSLIGPFAQEDANEGARIIFLRMSHKSKKSIVRIDSIEIKKGKRGDLVVIAFYRLHTKEPTSPDLFFGAHFKIEKKHGACTFALYCR